MTQQQSIDKREGLGALVGFRQELHGCLFGWADAQFELCDAMLCAPGPVASVPRLSLDPVFRRSHGSLYKALALGSIDTDWLRRTLVGYRPAKWPLVFAVDASTWARCDAETSPERGFHYSASKHSAGQPIVAGWSFQWISQLDWAPDSWTAPLDAMRIKPCIDATTATIDQVKRVVVALPDDDEVPLFVFDAGYDPIALGAGLAETRAQVLVRISAKRVFHPDPTPRPGGRRGAGPAATDPASPWLRTPPPGPIPTPSSPPTIPATATCACRPGAGCTPSSTAGADGPEPTSHRSCAAR
jgi:hypothetical protein